MRYGSENSSKCKIDNEIKLGLEDTKLDKDIYGNYDPTKADDDDDEKNNSIKSWDENLYQSGKTSVNETTDVHCYCESTFFDHFYGNYIISSGIE